MQKEFLQDNLFENPVDPRLAMAPQPGERIHATAPPVDRRDGAWNPTYEPVYTLPDCLDDPCAMGDLAGYRFTGRVWEAGPAFALGDHDDWKHIRNVLDEGDAIRVCQEHNTVLVNAVTSSPKSGGQSGRFRMEMIE